jgi:hypothetical protein
MTGARLPLRNNRLAYAVAFAKGFLSLAEPEPDAADYFSYPFSLGRWRAFHISRFYAKE